MPIVRSPFWRFFLTVTAGALALLAVVHGLRLTGYRLDLPGVVVLGLVWAVAIGWLVLGYWRRIDEAAQEAQKWAWFWGGQIGLGLGALAVAMPPLGLANLAPADASRADLMLYGAGVVIVAALVGFMAAWTFWWARRR